MSKHPSKANAASSGVRMRISKAIYTPNKDSVLVTGWVISGIDKIARIMLRSGTREQPAMIGLARPDVLQNVPDAVSQFVGYAVQMHGLTPDTSTRLEAIGFDGRLLQRIPLPTLSEPSRKCAGDDRVAAHFVNESRLLAIVISGVSAAASAQMGLTLPDGTNLTAPTYFLPQAKVCQLLRVERTGAAAHVATFVLPEGTLPESCKPWLFDAEGRVTYPALSNVYSCKNPASIGLAAHVFDETGALLIKGQCSFLGVTHVTVMHRGKVVASARSFLHEKAAKLEDVRSEVFLPFLCSASPGDRIVVQLNAGEHRILEKELAVRSGDPGRAPALLGTPARLSNGIALYDLQAEPANDDRPWIIYATGLPLWPVTGGGATRSMAMVKAIRAMGFRVLLVSESPTGPNHSSVQHLRETADAVAIISKTPMQDTPAREADLMFRRHNVTLAEVLETIEVVFRPRATIINFAFNMHATGRLQGPVILDAHDVQHLRAANARSQGANLEDRRCTRAEEMALLSRAHAVIAIQSEEAKILQSMVSPGIPVAVIGHTQEVNSRLSPPDPARLRRLLFVGQLYEPNIVGLKAFLEQVWQKLRRRVDGIELHVVGRVSEAFRDQDLGPRVFLHGVVPDLSLYYDNCGIAINPTIFGTGLKIKTLEAMAHMLCVVATPEGTLGIAEDAPIRRTPIEGFAEAIEALVSDPDAAGELARQSADFVRHTLRPEVVFSPLATMIASLPPPRNVPEAPIYALGGYRHAGNALHIRLDRAKDSPKAGRQDEPVSLLLRFVSAASSEIVLHLAVMPRDQLEVALPLDNVFSNGGILMGVLWLNDRSLGEVCLPLAMPERSTGKYLMSNWYYRDLRHVRPVSLLGRVGEAMVGDRGSNRGAETGYALVSRDQVIGHAFGPSWQESEPIQSWLNHLVLSPPHLGRLVANDIEFVDLTTGMVAAEVTTSMLRQALDQPQLLLEGRGIGAARGQPLVIYGENPLTITTDDAVEPPWVSSDSVLENRLTALVLIKRRLIGLDLVFHAEPDDDDLWHWQALLNGRSADERKVAFDTRKDRHRLTLIWAKGTNLGLYNLRLVFQKTGAGRFRMPLFLVPLL